MTVLPGSLPAAAHPLPTFLAAMASRPGDHGCEGRASHLYPSGQPDGVRAVRDEREIAAALAYARRENVPLGARSGGHGISGRSANDAGLAIALSRLASQTVLVL